MSPLIALLMAGLRDSTVQAPEPADSVVVQPTPAAERPRGLSRLYGTLRPFFNVSGSGGGAIGDLAFDHSFAFPLKLGIELSPMTVAFQSGGSGVVSHLRFSAAFATHYLELGAAVGGRMENFGPGGVSLAPHLRLGALDGLNFQLTYGYAIIRNHYTGNTRVAFSHVMGALQVPLSARLALTVDGAFSFDVWLYATLGLRYRFIGDGGPGSWILRGAFGAAWVLDRFPCQYSDPGRCDGAAWGVGPTLSLGVEHRF